MTRVTTPPDALAPLPMGGTGMCRVEAGPIFAPLLPPLPPLSPRRPQPHRSHETSLSLCCWVVSVLDDWVRGISDYSSVVCSFMCVRGVVRSSM